MENLRKRIFLATSRLWIQIYNIMKNHYDSLLEWDIEILLGPFENGIHFRTMSRGGGAVRMNYFSCMPELDWVGQ